MGEIASREAWLEARLELLEEEKALQRQADAVARKRRALPRVPVEAAYVFDSEHGPLTLGELFGDSSQLIVQHFMLGPDWEAGCPMCSFWADGYDPLVVHLRARDVSFVAVSRAPVESILAYRSRMGWSFPWVSSLGNTFNFDYHVSATPDELAAGRTTCNYRPSPVHSPEMPGTSVFVRDEMGRICHTCSTYARGLERLNAAYAFLDLVPRGRDEGGLPFPMAWVRRHDEYL